MATSTILTRGYSKWERKAKAAAVAKRHRSSDRPTKVASYGQFANSSSSGPSSPWPRTELSSAALWRSEGMPPKRSRKAAVSRGGSRRKFRRTRTGSRPGKARAKSATRGVARRGLRKFRKRVGSRALSKNASMYTSALRHIMCQPCTISDRETWTQGQVGNRSAYQSFYIHQTFPPRLVTQMFQQASATALNSSASAVPLTLEWFMKSLKMNCVLVNNSYSRTKVIVYKLKARRDILQTFSFNTVGVAGVAIPELLATGPMLQVPGGSVHNVLEAGLETGATAMVGANTTSSKAPTDSTLSDAVWVCGGTPFKSPSFTRYYKVVSKKTLELEPGAQFKMTDTVQNKVMSMGKFLSPIAYAGGMNTGTQDFALEDQYQVVRSLGYQYLVQCCGSLTNDTNTGRSGEFTTQAAADVGVITHELSCICSRELECYFPFNTTKRQVILTGTSTQAGTGPGLDTTITQAHQQIIRPTLTENGGNIG